MPFSPQLFASPEFRGCPFLNAASELPDPDHPAREATRRHREWLHGLVRGLVEAAGVGDVDRVRRTIVVLYDGAVSSALLDGDSRAVGAARFAMERLLDEAQVLASRASEGRARRRASPLLARPR